MYKYSVIIPVYNRPDELRELLHSLTLQSFKNFEVIIVEDGSTVKSDDIASSFSNQLELYYHFKPNSGPGMSRNFGIEKAKGDYYIIFDSDCIIPEHYFKSLDDYLQKNPCDCFGGPDKSHPSFTPIQKAISYTMTAFLTTGGIRGGDKKITRFYPRSFNMGFNKKVFTATQGYAPIRFGEDLDLSMRIEKAGFISALIPECFVYHKRRTDFRKFYKQIYNSGVARINLHLRHPGSLKITHFIPALFVVFTIISILSALLFLPLILPLLTYTLLIGLDSSIKNKSLQIGVLSIVSCYVQMFAYGNGFLHAFWTRIILQQKEFTVFEKNFYK